MRFGMVTDCHYADVDPAGMRFYRESLDKLAECVAHMNAEKVREILEESGKVRAAFQGHHHEGRHRQINGIHYYTLRAVVESQGEGSNSYAIVKVADDLTICLVGYQRAVSATL